MCCLSGHDVGTALFLFANSPVYPSPLDALNQSFGTSVPDSGSLIFDRMESTMAAFGVERGHLARDPVWVDGALRAWVVVLRRGILSLRTGIG